MGLCAPLLWPNAGILGSASQALLSFSFDLSSVPVEGHMAVRVKAAIADPPSREFARPPGTGCFCWICAAQGVYARLLSAASAICDIHSDTNRPSPKLDASPKRKSTPGMSRWGKRLEYLRSGIGI